MTDTMGRERRPPPRSHRARSALRMERKEDVRFLTGAGQYTDDVTLPHQTHAYFLRSPHAHAKHTLDQTRSKAKAAPGVVAVYTGADLPRPSADCPAAG